MQCLKTTLYTKPTYNMQLFQTGNRGRCGHDRLVIGFVTTYVISAYQHKRCEFEPVQARCTRCNIMRKGLLVTSDELVFTGCLHQ